MHVLVSLTFFLSFNQVNEWLNTFSSQLYRLVNWGYIDGPHVNSKIVITASEDIFTICRDTNILDISWMSDKTHSLMWISIKRQLDQSNDLLVC